VASAPTDADMISALRKSYGQFITSGTQLVLLYVGVKLDSRTGWLVCLVLIAFLSCYFRARRGGR
jgi:hypothetical protein